jgi:hypothetical protein
MVLSCLSPTKSTKQPSTISKNNINVFWWSKIHVFHLTHIFWCLMRRQIDRFRWKNVWNCLDPLSSNTTAWPWALSQSPARLVWRNWTEHFLFWTWSLDLGFHTFPGLFYKIFPWRKRGFPMGGTSESDRKLLALPGVAGVAGVIVRRGHSHGSIRPAMQNALWKLHEIIYLYILYLSTMIFFTVFAWSLWMLCDGIQSLVQCVWFDHLVPDTMHPYASLGDLGEQRVRCAQRSCALLVHEPTF